MIYRALIGWSIEINVCSIVKKVNSMYRQKTHWNSGTEEWCHNERIERQGEQWEKSQSLQYFAFLKTFPYSRYNSSYVCNMIFHYVCNFHEMGFIFANKSYLFMKLYIEVNKLGLKQRWLFNLQGFALSVRQRFKGLLISESVHAVF